MTDGHLCPFTVGQLLAMYAVLHVRGDHALAAMILAHSRQHEAVPPANLPV